MEMAPACGRAATRRRASIAAALGAAALVAGVARAGDPLVKVVEVSGGTLVLAGRDGAKAKVDVYGIVGEPDAGRRADELVRGKLVAVRPTGRKPDGTNVGVIYLEDGRSLGELLLEEGLARWDREHAPDAPGYEALERAPELPEQARSGEAQGSLETLESRMDAPSAEQRSAAARALGDLGAPAVPALLGGLRDGSELVWRQAAASLGRIGRAAVAPLLAALQDQEGVEHDRALRALALAGPAASAAIPAFAAILELPSGQMRSDAMHALGSMGDAADVALPGLVKILRDDAAHERLQAARAFGRIGLTSDDAAAGLRSRVIGDAAVGVQEEAARALERMGETETVDWLMAALATPRAEMAVISLGKMGARARRALPALVAAAAEQRLRLNASAALGDVVAPLAAERQGSDVSAAISLLTEMLEDPMLGVRSNAEISLMKVGLDALPLDVVVRLLSSREPRCRVAAAQAFNVRGAEAAPHVDALVACLGDATRGVRANCLQAIVKVGPAGAKALPAVVPMLSDDSYDTRIMACWVIGAMGEEAEPHVMALVALLGREPMGEVRRHVATSLGKLGPVAVEAIPALQTAAAKDPEPDVRAAAAGALEKVRVRR